MSPYSSSPNAAPEQGQRRLRAEGCRGVQVCRGPFLFPGVSSPASAAGSAGTGALGVRRAVVGAFGAVLTLRSMTRGQKRGKWDWKRVRVRLKRGEVEASLLVAAGKKHRRERNRTRMRWTRITGRARRITLSPHCCGC